MMKQPKQYEEELHQMKMKMTSFLTLDIPYLLKRIQEQLYHIEKKWKKASSKQEFVATELKGYIHLQHLNVLKGTFDCTLKRHTLDKIALAGPYALRQLVEADLLLQHMMKQVVTIQERFKTRHLQSVLKNNEKIGMTQQIFCDCYQFLDKFSSSLRQAAQLFQNPSKNKFPNGIRLEQSFKPAPPRDVIIEMNIYQAQLNLSVYNIGRSNKPIDYSVENDGFVSLGKELVHKVVNFENQTVEILDHVSVQVQVPVLGSVVQTLDDMIYDVLTVRDHAHKLLQSISYCEEIY